MGARVAALASAAALTACGVLSPEEQLLTRFFEASRLHDTTVASTMSAVTFNPRTDGVVREFEIARIERAGDAEEVIVNTTIATAGGQLVERVLSVRLERRAGRWFIAALR